jgi:hypothetical protein
VSMLTEGRLEVIQRLVMSLLLLLLHILGRLLEDTQCRRVHKSGLLEVRLLLLLDLLLLLLEELLVQVALKLRRRRNTLNELVPSIQYLLRKGYLRRLQLLIKV